MYKFFVLLTLTFAGFTNNLFAQDTFPKVSVKNINKQIIVSWKNNYGAKISYINIQRSKDSLKGYRTIGTVLNPLNKENGFVDGKTDSTNYFYRVFVAFTGGTYFFSKAQKPLIDTIRKKVAAPLEIAIVEPEAELPLPSLPPTLPQIKKGTKVKEEEELIIFRKFHPKRIPIGFIPNKFIFTDKDNNLVIKLPDAEKENYSVQIYNINEKLILEIKKIKESFLIAEKVNFMHIGWFYYHLYNDGILLEKYKFYIGKEGRIGQPPPELKNIADTIK